MKEIKIELSRTKLFFLLFGSLIFVFLGILFLVNPEKFTSFRFRSETTIFISGILSILFFGLCFFFILKKILDKRIGLIINEKGFVDNSSAISLGFVPWQDVSEVFETKVANQCFVSVNLKNPEDYFKKQNNILIRKSLEINFKNFNSLISISSNSLKIKHDNLLEIFSEYFEKYKNKNQ